MTPASAAGSGARAARRRRIVGWKLSTAIDTYIVGMLACQGRPMRQVTRFDAARLSALAIPRWSILSKGIATVHKFSGVEIRF